MVRLTFRNDISSSIPSLSNLCGGGEEGGGGLAVEKEQEGWGSVRWADSRITANVKEVKQSTIPQDFLTGSDRAHTPNYTNL